MGGLLGRCRGVDREGGWSWRGVGAGEVLELAMIAEGAREGWEVEVVRVK